MESRAGCLFFYATWFSVPHFCGTLWWIPRCFSRCFLPSAFISGAAGGGCERAGRGGVLESSSTKKHVLFVEDARGDY